jgi:hypothetical protein
MKKYALLNENNIVVNISVANDDWDYSGWIEYTENNPATIGGDYVNGFFYSVQPWPSWTRDNGQWICPVAMPSQGYWLWDEENLQWLQLES